jgi:hypothetical protein
MFVEINERIRRYHVSFGQTSHGIFLKGPNKGRTRTVTTCEIWRIPYEIGRAKYIVGKGVTTLGKTDSLFACKLALTRALDDAKLGKETNAAFWKEFHEKHQPTCCEAFSNVGGIYDGRATIPTKRETCPHRSKARGNAHDWCVEHKTHCSASTGCGRFNNASNPLPSLHGYGGFHSFQKKALERLRGGRSAYYVHRRSHAGESFIPRDKFKALFSPDSPEQEHRRMKDAIYRDMYGYRAPAYRQAESRCHRVGDRHTPVIVNVTNPVGGSDWVKKVFEDNKDRITEIIGGGMNERRRKWLHGLWDVSDEKLTARMHGMELIAADEFARVEKELLSRPGVSKVHNEYIIDSEEFVPKYKVGRVLRHDGQPVRVVDVAGCSVEIQPLVGNNRTVMDWELELLYQPHWIVRAYQWVKKWWDGIAEIDRLIKPDVSPDVTHADSLEYGKRTRTIKRTASHTLYDRIQKGICVSCKGMTIWTKLDDVDGLKTVQCKYCGKKVSYDPTTGEAKEI